MKHPAILILAALACTACETLPTSVECLATAHVAPDVTTYTFHRVGILPINGALMDPGDASALQGALSAELGRRMHVEIVPLTHADLEAVQAEQGFRSGRASPRSILELTQRFQVDGLLATTITARRDYQPLRLGLEVELIACDTGQPVWTSTVKLDSAEERVRRALQAWFETERSSNAAGETWDLYLLSPRRFGEFAAAQALMAF